MALSTAGFGTAARAQTASEWVALGKRVHGGFGSYIALGIRIGLHATRELGAAPRELDVTYFDGRGAPCPCVADGLMLAAYATPGQGSLRIAPSKSPAGTFGAALVRHKKTGRALRYTIPASARSLLDAWNRQPERARFDRVMTAPQARMFSVQPAPETQAR